jgi:Lar family restriction alleviation protein
MKLKPCPFCGSEHLEYFSGWAKNQLKITGGRQPSICCLSCDISIQTGYYGFGISDSSVENEIIEKWNSRV